ncbi:MAG: carbohydrate-binding protein [Flavobacteriales bacterium]
MKLISHWIFILLISTSSLYAQQIILPVEVLGAEGKVVTRTFNLSLTEATNSVKLWLQINNLSYQNKASIQINNGSWLPLNHQTVNMQAQEKARGGMVHGGFNTIRLTIPSTGIIPGANTISFRFDLSDAISNGYRVVRFNLLDSNANKILADGRFKEDDPNTWVGKYTDAASIAEGQNLWYNAPLKSNYLPAVRKGFWYTAEINPGGPIKATCSSCHVQDGRDLEIFSYSNEAIVERAKFHQLSEDEGEKIASYIRSLSATKSNVGRWGRPWNPPYQPGPSVAKLPVEQWAAGAGLDAVLEQDKDMLPYLFPNGVDQQKVYEHFDSEKTLDRTTLPLAIQFPDWKHWLPMIHPMDAYSKNDYWNSPGRQYDPKQGYIDFRNYLLAMPPANRNKAELMQKNGDFWLEYRGFLAEGGTWDHWRTKNGSATANLADGVSREWAATSLARLMAVQYFEFMNEFNLQDKAKWFTKPGELPNDQSKDRQWFGENYQVFEIPAHFQACVNNDCNQFMGQPTETGFYESTTWYHLQLILNGGEGMMSWNSPVDYNYHPDFMTKASNSSGIYEPLRYYHSMNAMYQTRTWIGGQSPNTGLGFRIRVMGPWNIYGVSDGNQFNGFASGEFAKLLDDVEPGMTAWVLNAMLKQFLKEVNQPFNDLAIWNRSADGGDNELDRADKTYADIIDAVQRTERYETFFGHYAAKFYYYIPRFQKLGVDCQIMEDVIDWCQKAWPLIDWHVFSNKGEMQLNLLLADEQFCSSSNKIKAIATNVTANTIYNWKVNGNTAAGTGDEFSTANLQPGDIVTCQISSNSTCLLNNSVESTFVVPSKGYHLTMKKTGDADFKALENIVACTNDQLELKLNIDMDIQPKQWLDAMDVNPGNEPANNSLISSWYDKSGNGFNANANKAELQPRYVTNAMNGLPAIVFGSDNNADGLELFSTSEDDFLNNDWTIMFVGSAQKPTGNDDWRDVIGNKTEGANGWFWRFGSSARVQAAIGPDLQHGQNYNFDRGFLVQINKKGDVITFYLNGKSDRVITKGANVTMTINDALYIGQSAAGNIYSNRYHKGPICELMVFESVISGAQKEFLEGYLCNKWKINHELSLTHSYVKKSPFDLVLNTPNGDQHQFDAIQTSHTINLDQINKFGTYDFTKEVCGAVVENISIVSQSPYGGTAWAIPGKIEAEDYDNGCEGTAYHDNEAANYGGASRQSGGVDIGNCQEGGYNVGFIGWGEWLKYTVNVTTEGVYELQARVASPNANRSFHVELDGVDISGAIAVPVTGSWDGYQTVNVTTQNLTAGQHVMRIYIDAGDFNLNYLNFDLLTTGIAPDHENASAIVFPNPAKSGENIHIQNLPADGDLQVRLYNYLGSVIYSSGISSGASSAQIQLPQNMASGYYQLEINGNEYSFRKSIVVY